MDTCWMLLSSLYVVSCWPQLRSASHLFDVMQIWYTELYYVRSELGLCSFLNHCEDIVCVEIHGLSSLRYKTSGNVQSQRKYVTTDNVTFFMILTFMSPEKKPVLPLLLPSSRQQHTHRAYLYSQQQYSDHWTAAIPGAWDKMFLLNLAALISPRRLTELLTSCVFVLTARVSLWPAVGPT